MHIDISKCTMENLNNKELIIRTRIPKVPMYVMVYNIIYNLIQNGEFKEGDQIPTENFWAEHLEVSRSTIRMALVILQEDGILVTQQGKGTFVADRKRSEKIQVSGLSFQAKDIISASNKEYSCKEQLFRYVNYDTFLYEKLKPGENERIGIISKKHYADGQLVAVSQYFFLLDKDVLKPKADFETADNYYKSLLNKENCKTHYSFAPTMVSNENKDMFGKDVADALLLIKYEVFDGDRRVIFSKDYYNTNAINVELISVSN